MLPLHKLAKDEARAIVANHARATPSRIGLRLKEYSAGQIQSTQAGKGSG